MLFKKKTTVPLFKKKITVVWEKITVVWGENNYYLRG